MRTLAAEREELDGKTEGECDLYPSMGPSGDRRACPALPGASPAEPAQGRALFGVSRRGVQVTFSVSLTATFLLNQYQSKKVGLDRRGNLFESATQRFK